MKTIYIVVEGKTDEIVLDKLLDRPKNTMFEFFVAEGVSNTLTMARTIYDLRPSNKIILIVDDDTLQGNFGVMYRAQLNTYLYSIIDSSLFHFFTMSPNLEGELFNGMKDRDENLKYLDTHKEELRKKPIIQNVQAFINAPTRQELFEELI